MARVLDDEADILLLGKLYRLRDLIDAGHVHGILHIGANDTLSIAACKWVTALIRP